MTAASPYFFFLWRAAAGPITKAMRKPPKRHKKAVSMGAFCYNGWRPLDGSAAEYASGYWVRVPGARQYLR